MGSTPSSNKEQPPLQQPPPPSATSADACPVDESTRKAYLAAAASRNGNPPPPSNHPPSPSPNPYLPQKRPRLPQDSPLASDRVTSSIPRAATSPSTTTPSPSSLPTSPNPSSESHPSHPTPSDAARWIYPSEKMFFDAMRRKSYSPDAADMRTIVPIHNAVNERAWSEILSWESSSPRAVAQNQGCGGPKLRAFSGDSGKLTPRARWYGLLGYERPFDRHDWVVERCGGPEEAVEYVIDFYRGRGSEGAGGLNFYLDVRPKLNSWEGWRMRMGRLVGW